MISGKPSRIDMLERELEVLEKKTVEMGTELLNKKDISGAIEVAMSEKNLE